MRSRATLRTIADAVAVLTGLSFILSALIQEAIFVFWGLDFTAVASFEDVILGGLRLLFFASLATAAGAIYFLWQRVIFEKTLEPKRHSSTYMVRIVVNSLVAVCVCLWMIIWTFFMETADLAIGLLVLVLTLYLYSILSTIIVISTSPLSLRNTLEHVGRARPVNRIDIALSMLGGVLISVAYYYYVPYINLTISYAGNLPKDCRVPGFAPPPVLWMGTRAFVLKCRSRNVVVFPGEEPFSLIVR
jgi:hypothetical protein